MTFSIGFDSEYEGGDPVKPEGRYGSITLGAFHEHFLASLAYWSPAKYENQWRQAIERISSGADRSCLLTSIGDPREAVGAFCWALYRYGSTVYVQNVLLVFDQLSAPFDLANPTASIRSRQTENDEGQAISEWEVSVDDLLDFLARTKSD